MQEKDIAKTFYFLAATANNIANDHGWWEEGKEATPLESHMLFVGEIAESMEEIRDGHQLGEVYFKHDPGCLFSEFPLYLHRDTCKLCVSKPEGSLVELADTFIRIFDYLGHHDLTGAFIRAYVEKTEYNRSRPYRHGGKTA